MDLEGSPATRGNLAAAYTLNQNSILEMASNILHTPQKQVDLFGRQGDAGFGKSIDPVRIHNPAAGRLPGYGIGYGKDIRPFAFHSQDAVTIPAGD